MNEKETFIEFVKSALGEEIYNKSGTLLYSPFNTLKKGKYMILGLNPGGDPNEIKETIKEKLEELDYDGESEYCKPWYADDRIHPLQKNLRKIAEVLNFNLNDVCSTNLFFSRTENQKKLHWKELSESKKVHEKLLSIVQPDVIFIFGKIPYDEYKKFLEDDLSYDIMKEDERKAEHGEWMIRFYTAKADRNIKVIGLPHLSVYTIYTKPVILEWLKKEVENHKP